MAGDMGHGGESAKKHVKDLEKAAEDFDLSSSQAGGGREGTGTVPGSQKGGVSSVEARGTMPAGSGAGAGSKGRGSGK